LTLPMTGLTHLAPALPLRPLLGHQASLMRPGASGLLMTMIWSLTHSQGCTMGSGRTWVPSHGKPSQVLEGMTPAPFA